MSHEKVSGEENEPVELLDAFGRDILHLGYDHTNHSERLDTLSPALFKESKAIKVNLIRVPANSSLRSETITRIESEIELDEELIRREHNAILLIAFHQECSLAPLECSRSAMQMTITLCLVSPMFMDVLLKFGDQEKVFEESSGFRQSWTQPDGSFEACYQLMYVEPSNRRGRYAWAIRQTGVYHRFDAKSNQNLFLVLYPRENSRAQCRIEEYAGHSDKGASLAEHPMNVHLVILSSCINFWQSHIEDLANQLAEIRKYILVWNTNDYQFEPAKLQNLRNLEDKIVCKALRCLRSTHDLVKTLMSISQNLPAGKLSPKTAQIEQQLHSYLERLEGHINAADTLAERIRATMGLLANLMDIQNHEASSQTNKHMLKLTHESVDDNATVRVITVFTLIYLPASFMATLLGMNLFDFQEDNGALRISPFFWIYIAAIIPLTIVTVGAWYLFKLQHDKRKRLRRDAEQAPSV